MEKRILGKKIVFTGRNICLGKKIYLLDIKILLTAFPLFAFIKINIFNRKKFGSITRCN